LSVANEVRFRLKPRQFDVLADPTRFRVVVAGRRSGKTFGECVELFREAGQKEQARCWYIAPTYRQARDIAWEELKRLIPRQAIAGTPNESRLEIRLVTGSEIALKGADNPDSLRGPGLDFAAFDEFAWIQPYAWDVVRPMLADRMGRALFTTTPAGHNWAYDLFLRGRSDDPDWKSWQYTTAEAGVVPVSEVEASRADLDPRIFRQEYEASFETLQGRVYDNFSRDTYPAGNVDASVEDTGGDILTGMDFNVHPMSAVIGVRAGDECHILDAIEIPTSNTEEMAREIRSRYPDRRLIVCPDPSGKSRKTSAPVGQTDFTILERHGFEVRAPDAAPPVVDRINNTQAMMLNAGGRRRIRVHPRAHPLIRAWDGLTFKQGTQGKSQVDKTLGLDHLPDAADYLLWSEFNVLQAPVHHTRAPSPWG
jgi:hypothetical protein